MSGNPYETNMRIDQLLNLREVMVRAGMEINDDPVVIEKLEGGVSSIILKVLSASKTYCIKQALPVLKVAKVWHAPVERIYSEINWLKAVAQILPGMVPEVLGVDRLTNSFIMPFFPPEHYSNWKTELFSEKADISFAASVGKSLAQIHSATANSENIRNTFDNDDIFYALRLEPYFIECANIYPGIADHLKALVARTQSLKISLIHGDISPKNILAGPNGPVFLDAECAVYGDPAFDVAFCLHHILFKSIVKPDSTFELLEAFDALSASYLSGVTWESREPVEMRIAGLLPALMLARISGKSPLDYLDSNTRQISLGIAMQLINSPAIQLREIRQLIIQSFHE